jgi:hypothetical protein
LANAVYPEEIKRIDPPRGRPDGGGGTNRIGIGASGAIVSNQDFFTAGASARIVTIVKDYFIPAPEQKKIIARPPGTSAAIPGIRQSKEQ